MQKEELASHLDFANHHPDATAADIKKLCAGVLRYGFNSAFVNQSHVQWAKQLLKKRAKVGTVVSFPLGQDSFKSKLFSAIGAAKAGADELDVSMNVGLFKEKKYALVLKEMSSIVHAVKRINNNKIVKFIIETGYLSDKEIAKASKLVVQSGADFVKTCSGMGPRGASLKDVRLIRKAIGHRALIKVAGGITTTAQAKAFLEATANRMGTSHAIDIVLGLRGKKSGGE